MVVVLEDYGLVDAGVCGMLSNYPVPSLLHHEIFFSASIFFKWSVVPSLFQIMKKESDRFHVLYDSVQHLASSLPVHDFCLTEASLEDVFIILNQKYDTE